MCVWYMQVGINVCLYMHIYIYIYTHTHHIYINMYLHSHTHKHISIYIDTYFHVYVWTYIYIYIVHTFTPTYTSIYTAVYTYIYIYKDYSINNQNFFLLSELFSININSRLFRIGLWQKLFILTKILVLRLFKMVESQTMLHQIFWCHKVQTMCNLRKKVWSVQKIMFLAKKKMFTIGINSALPQQVQVKRTVSCVEIHWLTSKENSSE